MVLASSIIWQQQQDQGQAQQQQLATAIQDALNDAMPPNSPNPVEVAMDQGQGGAGGEGGGRGD